MSDSSRQAEEALRQAMRELDVKKIMDDMKHEDDNSSGIVNPKDFIKKGGLFVPIESDDTKGE